ncbi:MAG: hypothetical protein AB1346_07065 [Thermodesulfobacteriota bacterium]
MRGKTVLAAAAFLFLALAAFAGNGECMGRNKETVMLKGTVRVVGNAPFTQLVLTVPGPGADAKPVDHLVQGPLAGEMRSRLQGKVVTVEAAYCAEKPPGRLPCIEPSRIVEDE